MKHKINHLLVKTLIACGGFVVILIAFIWYMSRGYAYIKVAPRNAQVSIDGLAFKVNSKGIYKKAVTPGTHSIEIAVNGYVGQAKNVNFRHGIKTTLNANLVELPTAKLLEKKGKFLFADKDGFYYLGSNDSILYKGEVDKEKNTIKTRPLTDAKLTNIKDIFWSPARDLALFRKTDNKVDLFDFKKYDFINQTEVPWSDPVGDIAWAPDNSKIAYYFANANENSLIFANVTNSDKERVINFDNFGIKNPALHWSSDSQYLLIVPRNKNKDENKIYVFNSYTRSLRQLTDGGNFSDATFLNNTKILAMENDGSSVLINRENPSDQKDLGFKTWPENVQVLDDNYAYILTTKNSLFKLNSTSGKKEGISIEKLSDGNVDLSAVYNEGKIIIYQTSLGIFVVTL